MKTNRTMLNGGQKDSERIFSNDEKNITESG